MIYRSLSASIARMVVVHNALNGELRARMLFQRADISTTAKFAVALDKTSMKICSQLSYNTVH